ncbi:protein BatD [Pseudoalteromonas sp. MMG010]|uniref:BatD family protein n=1 Tax=Pseudoalteromonas sp. MMG010 TaxID=2822685 RepID=UPI001B3A6CE4|nr:BatD family protein [Pseudoalteromonas sp. MMG010]MBQ4831845.1 protein BatD [Pseudoalteromonas sp. MMG010]
MVMRLICCLLLLSASPLWAASQLQASVDKNPVLAGEFFVLSISIDDSVNNEQPDTAPLLKDFVVGPLSKSSRTNIINGSMNKQTTWSIKLMTRKEGEYIIPAFTVAGVSSNPITLTVTKRAADADKNNDIYLETSLSADSLYVQEAGVYTVKLFLAKELLDGSLSAPTMPDAQLTQLGKQTEDYQLVNGKRYLVITREYLVQPQKSGVHTLQAPSFQGRVRQNYRQMAVSALGQDVTLEVKPIPANYQGDWLPSELVSLDEQWQPEDSTIEVGTPITRTITLTALGVTKDQLPDLEVGSVNEIRSYPDAKENNNAVRNGRVVSQQVASYALLPQTPGTYTLPKVTLPWFNTKINQISYASLPERTITVTPNSNSVNSQVVAPQTETQNINPENSSYKPTQDVVIKEKYPLWLIFIAVLGYILWLVTAIYFYFNRSTTKAPIQVSQNSAKTVALNTLKAHAKEKNYKAFYKHLMTYAAQQTQQPYGGLDKLCEQLNNDQFTNAIKALQSRLYSNNQTDIELDFIVSTLELHANKSASTSENELTSLY